MEAAFLVPEHMAGLDPCILLPCCLSLPCAEGRCEGLLPDHRTASSSYMPLPNKCMSRVVRVRATAAVWLKVANIVIGTPSGLQSC